jgi:hypothetical protein
MLNDAFDELEIGVDCKGTNYATQIIARPQDYVACPQEEQWM